MDPQEADLWRRIAVNNALRRRIAEAERAVGRWAARAAGTRNRRRRRKLEATIERERARIAAWGARLRGADEELRPRLAEALKIAEPDAAAFQDRFRRELAGFVERATASGTARRKADDPSRAAPISTAGSVLRRIHRAGASSPLERELHRVLANLA
jgi:hypothetical protein